MPEEAEVVECLREAVVPLDGPEPGAGPADLGPLTETFAGREVVGLGEATHGTREFFQLKHRLVRLLVTELGFRVFALEAAFAETMATNDYVLRGEGDPEDALDGVYFWTWNTEEVLALIEWLREFNRGRDPGDRVRFYGFDLQHTAGSARAVREYLGDVDPEYLDGVREGMTDLVDEEMNQRGHGVAAARLDDAERLVADLGERFEERRADYVAASSGREWALARRHVRVLAQALALRRVDPDENPRRGVELRDEYMAENALWIREFESDRMAVWAHDAHVETGEMDDDWEEPVAVMGQHLRDALGDDYYALGFDFGRGEFQAILDTDEHEEGDGEEYEPGLQAFAVDGFAEAYDGDGDDGGGDDDDGGGGNGDGGSEGDGDLSDVPLHVAMDRLGESPAFLDFDRAKQVGLGDWLGREHPTRSIGATFSPEVDADEYYRQLRPSEVFDGVVWVAETSRAVPVDDG